MKLFLFAVASLAVIAGTTGCSSKQVKDSEVRRSSESYVQVKKTLQESRFIAPGNTIAVEHSGDSKVSGTYKVDFEGKIQMPYKVVLKVAGMTVSECKDSIQRAYQSYVRGASTVEVGKSRTAKSWSKSAVRWLSLVVIWFTWICHSRNSSLSPAVL